MDEGAPSSYLLLARDTPVFGSDGLVAGIVKEVLCDPAEDIFDGLVLTTHTGERALAAELVSAIHERGVDIVIPAEAVTDLPAPPAERLIKYDMAPGEHAWSEVMHWLIEHIDHLMHPGDERIAAARKRLGERKRALRLAREEPRLGGRARRGTPRPAWCV